jgi:type II secretory pathway pseudopilin PulG
MRHYACSVILRSKIRLCVVLRYFAELNATPSFRTIPSCFSGNRSCNALSLRLSTLLLSIAVISMRNRSGFSLKSLMVVVAAAAIALALLIPAIEAARESARRMSCSNNFKQIGLSIHNYHSAYRRCPSAMFGTQDNQQRLSGLIALTPFIESSPRWDTISNPSTFGGVNYPAMGPVPWDTNYQPWCENIPTFRCPSDGIVRGKLGRTNYAFAVADRIEGLYQGKAAADVRGFFAPGVVLSFRDVIDGLSNTIMMTEIGTMRARKLQGQFVLNRPVSLVDSPAECGQVKDPLRPLFYDESVTLSELGRGGAFADGAGGYSLVHLILPPNSPTCASGSVDPLEGVFSAGSYHADGCHVLMGDGAVIFITNSIETGDVSSPSPRANNGPGGESLPSPYGLWGALGTRAGEEVIEEQLVL